MKDFSIIAHAVKVAITYTELQTAWFRWPKCKQANDIRNNKNHSCTNIVLIFS